MGRAFTGNGSIKAGSMGRALRLKETGPTTVSAVQSTQRERLREAMRATFGRPYVILLCLVLVPALLPLIDQL